MADASEFLDCLRRDGWVRDRRARLTPLSGGVSSEIYLVEDGDSQFVVKRALARLKVKDDWFADVSRNASEWAFIECVGSFLPEAVPQVRLANHEMGYFGMEFLGDDFANWKALLLRGVVEVKHARMAGRILGEIHRRTTGRDDLRQRFDTTTNFHQLRTAPYLLTTGGRHPDLQELFVAEAMRLEATRECLIHGDFSPKNILIRAERMVLLDCEVAWYGDPAFDVAFLLNHLFLKGIYHAPHDLGFASMIGEFWTSYVASRQSVAEDWEMRVTRLLLMLMLARMDGKSPVEYLDPVRAQFVRVFVRDRLLAGSAELATLTADWFEQSRKLSPNSVNS
jgi:aminoglycoside phosphotransferase (APT) family kinase protein